GREPVIDVGQAVGRDVGAARLERALAPRVRVLTDGVEDDVVGLAVLREVFGGVVDQMVEPKRSHSLQVLRARHSGDLGPPARGGLTSGRADGAGRAVDEDGLPRLDVRELQALCVETAVGRGRSLLERERRGLGGEKPVRGNGCELSPAAETEAHGSEYL